MVCMPGKIQLQLPTNSYKRLREGVGAEGESTQPVVCHVCEKNFHARSLLSHLVNVHDIYLQVVVADDLLEERAGHPLQGRVGGAQDANQVPIPRVPGET